MGGHRVLAFFFIFGGMDTTETATVQVVEQLATCTIEQPDPMPWEANQRMQLTAHTVGSDTTYTLSTEAWTFQTRDGIYRLADKLAELAQAITP